jgi:hypothetical protein
LLTYKSQNKKTGDNKMRKTSFTLVVLAFSLILSIQIFGQSHRDIAVVGHNLNNNGVLANAVPNSFFNGFFGANTTFQVFTATPPQSWLKNKLNGVQQVGCNAVLNIVNVPGVIDFNIFNGAELLFNGAGNFNVVCGGTVLTGTFSRAILHVTNGSHSASITLFNDSVTYLAPTNLITNAVGNFAFNNGSLSIGIITDSPVIINPAAGSISEFRAYSDIVFGARKI